MRRTFLSAGAVVAVLATGCGPLGGSTGTAGELGNGVFSYTCTSPSDAACDGKGTGPMAMPKGIAVNGRFGATYSPTAVSPDKGSAVVEPVSKDLITDAAGLGSQFEAVKPGLAGLLAMRGTTVVDIVHVEVAPVDSIRILQVSDQFDVTGTEVTSLSLQIGDAPTLRAVPLGPGGDELAGALSCTWKSESASLMITSSPSDNEVTLQAISDGLATLSLTMGDATAQIDIGIGNVSGTGGSGTGGSGAGGTGGAL